VRGGRPQEVVDRQRIARDPQGGGALERRPLAGPDADDRRVVFQRRSLAELGQVLAGAHARERGPDEPRIELGCDRSQVVALRGHG
jgi:hypothetical protein